MAKGRPSLGCTRVHLLIRSQDLEDLKLYYPSYGMTSQVIRALVAMHVRKLNNKVGKRVALAPDEAEAHLLMEDMNVGGQVASAVRTGEQSHGRSGPGGAEYPDREDSTRTD